MEQREVLHAGYLRKSPPEEKIVKDYKWHKRYFKLWSDRKLEYYKRTRKSHPLRAPLDLNLCEGVEESNQDFKKHFSKNYRWLFSIKMPHRQYHFLAKTKEEREKWVNLLNNICQAKISTIENACDEQSFARTTSSVSEQSSSASSSMASSCKTNKSVGEGSVVSESSDADFNYDELPQSLRTNLPFDSIDGARFLNEIDAVNGTSTIEPDYNLLPPPVLAFFPETDDDPNTSYNILPPPVPLASSGSTSSNNQRTETPLLISPLSQKTKSLKQRSTKTSVRERFPAKTQDTGYVSMLSNNNSTTFDDYIKMKDNLKQSVFDTSKQFKQNYKSRSVPHTSSSIQPELLARNLHNIPVEDSHLDQIPVMESKHVHNVEKEPAPQVLRDMKPVPQFDRSAKPNSIKKQRSYGGPNREQLYRGVGSSYSLRQQRDEYTEHHFTRKKTSSEKQTSFEDDVFIDGAHGYNNNQSGWLTDQPINYDNVNILNTPIDYKNAELPQEPQLSEEMSYENVNSRTTAIKPSTDPLTYVTCALDYMNLPSHPSQHQQDCHYIAVDPVKSEAIKNLR